MAEASKTDAAETDAAAVDAAVVDGGESEMPPSGLGPARLAALVVGAVVAALVVLLALGPSDDAEGASALLGQRSPAIEGPVLIGDGTFDLDDHRGSWVLVNFFATWCPPCVAEHPELVALEAWGKQDGNLELVSVVFNDSAEQVASFFAERGGSWPVIDNPAVPVNFQVAQVPESFLIAPNGQVVIHVEGELSAAEIQRLIQENA